MRLGAHFADVVGGAVGTQGRVAFYAAALALYATTLHHSAGGMRVGHVGGWYHVGIVHGRTLIAQVDRRVATSAQIARGRVIHIRSVVVAALK